MSLNPNLSTTNSNESRYHFGIVESTSDLSGSFRVRVRIIGIHNENRRILPTSDLPFALVANSTNSTGKHSLKNGNFVVCTFLDNDYQQPLVLYSLFSKLRSSNVILNSLQDSQSPGAIFLNSAKNTIPDQILFNKIIPNDVVAKSQSGADVGNPLGQNSNIPIANGKSGGINMFADIEREIISLGNIFKYVELFDTDDITLTDDIDSDIDFLPLSRVTNIPKSGIVQVDDEIVTYVSIADTGITQLMRGSPDKGSIIPTIKSEHKKGAIVRWIFPVVKNDKAPLFFSKITGQSINFSKEIKKRMSVISGYITWLMSRISAQITQILSGLIAQITLILKSPIALVGKIIVDALLLILSQVLCAFDKATVDSLVASIEKTVVSEIENLIKLFYDNGKAIVDFIENCTNKIFDAILQFTSIIQSIGNLITNVTNLFPGVSSNITETIKGASSGEFALDDITKTAPIVATLLNFLGLGCKADIGENKQTYSDNQGTACQTSAYYPGSIQCLSNPDLIEVLNGLFRPLPQFITSYDFGGGLKIEQDNTPGTERTLITSPAGTYTEVFNDGTSKTVITKDQYTLILNDDHIEIKGNCFYKIDGDFALKVSGNMDLEVGKQLRTSVGGASQISYGGSHTTNYFGDSVLNAANKLSLIGSQIGLSASGTVDITGGIMNTLVSEINLLSTGSLNMMSLFSNHITAVSHKEIHSGIVDKLVVGSHKCVSLGNYSNDTIGNYSHNYMGFRTENVAGINTLTNTGLYSINSGIKIENVAGLDQSTSSLKITNSNLNINTINGASLNYAQGISLRKTEGINFDA